MSLRTNLIRLASDLPKGSKDRKAVLDLIAKHKRAGFAYDIGETVENEGVRAHRYRDSVEVTDLTFAGKRGKTVDSFSMDNLDPRRMTVDPQLQMLVEDFLDSIPKTTSYRRLREQANMISLQAQDLGIYGFRVYDSTRKGVHVAPAGFGPVKINGDHVYIRADWDSFQVADKDDQFNLPACIPAIRGGKADIKVFYRWVKDNEAKLRKMTFREVTRGMSEAGIAYHQYCRMD